MQRFCPASSIRSQALAKRTRHNWILHYIPYHTWVFTVYYPSIYGPLYTTVYLGMYSVLKAELDRPLLQVFSWLYNTMCNNTRGLGPASVFPWSRTVTLVIKRL